MRTFNTNEMTQQFDNLFMAPVRAYMTLSIDYSEKLLNAQLDANKAYVDTGLAQVRQLMSVKDADGLRSYMESQQKVAKDLAERVKGDADKVVGFGRYAVRAKVKAGADAFITALDQLPGVI